MSKVKRKLDTSSESINTKFRLWTRGTSFSINLGKSQVKTLIAMDVSKEDHIGFGHPMLNNFVTAVRGLESRGLYQRPKSYDPKKNDNAPIPISSAFEPTEAGNLIIQLMKITGIYQEIKEELLSYKRNKYGYYYSTDED